MKPNTESSLVFPGKDGAMLTDAKHSWETILKLAQIKNFRWHDMRHHFASRLVMAGVDLNTVRELLGHSDLKMTIRYAHLCPNIKAEAVSRLDAKKTFFSQQERLVHADKSKTEVESSN
jgi:site-specific recombinase XerD